MRFFTSHLLAWVGGVPDDSLAPVYLKDVALLDVCRYLLSPPADVPR
jgi:hypothetical protein